MPSIKKKHKARFKTDISKIRTLDSFFVDEPVRKDEFGFFTALSGEQVEGYFAAFDIDGAVKATPIYSREVLEDLVIPDVLKSYPGVAFKIYPESEFRNIVKKT